MPTSDVALGSVKNANLWTGKPSIDEWNELILVRNIGLNSIGGLNPTSIKLADSLEILHHEGAGREEDFVSKGEYKKHIRKNEKWASKRKKKNTWLENQRSKESQKTHTNTEIKGISEGIIVGYMIHKTKGILLSRA